MQAVALGDLTKRVEVAVQAPDMVVFKTVLNNSQYPPRLLARRFDGANACVWATVVTNLSVFAYEVTKISREVVR